MSQDYLPVSASLQIRRDPQVFIDPGRNKEVAEHLQELFDMTSLEIVATQS